MDIEDKLEQLLIECQVNPEFSGQAVYELIYHFEHNIFEITTGVMHGN